MSSLEKMLCLVRWLLMIISQDAKQIPESKHDTARILFEELSTFLCSDDEFDKATEPDLEAPEIIYISGDTENLSEDELQEIRQTLIEATHNVDQLIPDSSSSYQMMLPELLELAKRMVSYFESIASNCSLEQLINCNKEQALKTSVECPEDEEIYNLWQSFKFTQNLIQMHIVQSLFLMLEFYLDTQADFTESSLKKMVAELHPKFSTPGDSSLRDALLKLLPLANKAILEIARRLAGDSEESIELSHDNEHISANDLANLLPAEVEKLLNT